MTRWEPTAHDPIADSNNHAAHRAIANMTTANQHAHMQIADPSHLRLRFLALGIASVAVLLSVANSISWLVRYGVEGALDVDGGGGSTLGILIFVGGIGLVSGISLAVAARLIAPRSWLVAAVAVAAFCALGGRFNASLVFTLDHWIEGALLTLAIAAASIGAGTFIQWLSGHRSGPT